MEASRIEPTAAVERQEGSPEVSRYLNIVLRHALSINMIWHDISLSE